MEAGEVPKEREKQEDKYKAKYEKLLQQCTEKDARIKELEHENKKLLYSLAKLRDSITDIIDGK